MAGSLWKTTYVEGSPRVCVDVAGEGPLLVFLHGIGGNRLSWHLQLPEFSKEFTAVAWDARGYGGSDDYDGELNFSDFSHDLERLLNHYGAQKAHICGTSMGGRIAQDFMALYPDRVATLILCDTFAGDDENDARASRTQTIDEFVESRIRPFLDGAAPVELARKRGGRLMAPEHSEDARRRAIEASSQLHVESYIKTVRASAAFSRIDNLAKINVPTLLLFGEQDPLTPPTVADYMMEKISGAELVVIDKAGHMPYLEQPDAFNSAVLKFLMQYRDLAD
ncbi:MAG: alpha/beta hydrolase [Rhodospirillaceae bacterium]|nr:alpha/beta hydrolase [Rhodospirillaceae bacterium]|tara:strand:- start:9041 stop:9880 length:840 start_codon:yes stop_codon:yes gene_type:complete